MKKNVLFIGIDVSKKTLDIANWNAQTTKSIENSQGALGKEVKYLITTYPNFTIKVGVENTGIYNYNINEVLPCFDIELYVFNPLHLKKSIGLARGKNDAIDALRIASHLHRYENELTPHILVRKPVERLKSLMSLRNRHVKYRKSYKQAAKEINDMEARDLAKDVNQSTNRIVKQISEEIKIIEQKITQIIEQDKRLNRLYRCITSVDGVGKVIAWTVIVKTNEFRTINDPRKLACFAGVVPFEYQSGSSIYRKPRVSFMADKALKKILTMGAIRVIQLEGELAEYYERKVREGKNKMSVINAIRNKLIARICSCVNNDRLYVKRLDLS